MSRPARSFACAPWSGTDAGKHSAEWRAPGAACWCRCRCGRWTARPASVPAFRWLFRSCLACSDPQILERGNGGGAIDHEVAVVTQPGLQPRQGLGRGAGELLAFSAEAAAVARAGNHTELGFPGRQASEMRADCVERKVSLGDVDEINASGGVERD